jgi:hypothetical protein
LSVHWISGSPSLAKLSRVDRPARHGNEASFDVTVFLDVQGDDRLEAGAGVGVEITPGDEPVGQTFRLVAGPCLEHENKLALIDQSVL